MNQSAHFIVIMPNGEELGIELTGGDATMGDLHRKAAERAVKLAGLTTTREKREKIEVKIRRVTLSKAVPLRGDVKHTVVALPIRKMSVTEYSASAEALLIQELPIPFHGYVLSICNDDADDDDDDAPRDRDYGPKLDRLRREVNRLKPAIASYDAMPKAHGVPWCIPCQSYHTEPTSKEMHAALQCKAPWKEPEPAANPYDLDTMMAAIYRQWPELLSFFESAARVVLVATPSAGQTAGEAIPKDLSRG